MKLHPAAVRSACLVLLVLALAAAPPSAAPAAAATTVKMATLVPQGSVWDRILRDMGAEWREATEGDVELRIYAGGVAGDEPDVVRKMRIGQLHAAAISTAGLTTIDPAFEVFQIPMFFRTYEELFHVLDTLRPEFEKRLDAKGYVLLNWGNGGWVKLFSTERVRTAEDLMKLKLFSWAGDESMISMWRKNGFQPVALAATDIHTGLQTGMVQAVPTTPLAALSLQWFRETPYMLDLPLAPLVGATVMSKRMWSQLPENVRREMKSIALDTEERILREIPQQDDEAIAQMKERGLEVVEISDAQEKAWRKIAEDFAEVQRQQMEAKDLLDQVRKVRDEYRAENEAGQDGSAP